MILFNQAMQKEKLASIALFVIIIGAVAIYIGVSYGGDLLSNLREEEKVIEIGDCADIHYIGTLSNGTVFDTTYNNSDTKTGGSPLQVFISLNQSAQPPGGYLQYSSGLIEGFMQGLIGLKEGETTVIGPIPAKDAYGENRLHLGSIFSTETLAIMVDVEVEVIQISEEGIVVKWINVEDFGNFTSPQAIISDFEMLQIDQSQAIQIPPPGYLWENSTRIEKISNDSVEVKIHPTTSEDIVEEFYPIYTAENLMEPTYFVIPNVTTATWDNDTITLSTEVEIGDNFTLSQDMYGTVYTTTFTVVDVSDTRVNFSIESEGEDIQYNEVDKLFTFNRTYEIKRIFEIPELYLNYFFSEDIEDAGYSIHPLAGEALTFEVSIKEVYKTSQDN
jgi:FKBP-type peptidyl-prolyl cis-trans isomerase 2